MWQKGEANKKKESLLLPSTLIKIPGPVYFWKGVFVKGRA